MTCLPAQLAHCAHLTKLIAGNCYTCTRRGGGEASKAPHTARGPARRASLSLSVPTRAGPLAVPARLGGGNRGTICSSETSPAAFRVLGPDSEDLLALPALSTAGCRTQEERRWCAHTTAQFGTHTQKIRSLNQGHFLI